MISATIKLKGKGECTVYMPGSKCIPYNMDRKVYYLTLLYWTTVTVTNAKDLRFLTNNITDVKIISVTGSAKNLFKDLNNVERVYYNSDSLLECTNLDGTFYGLSKVKKFPAFELNYKIKELNSTWYGCKAITEFKDFDFKHVELFTQTWEACTRLKNVNITITSGSKFYFAWAYCKALKTLPMSKELKGTYSLIGTPLH